MRYIDQSEIIGNPPEWVLDLVEQVCNDYKRTRPEIFQYYRSNWKSAGHWTWFYKRSRRGRGKLYVNCKVHITAREGDDKATRLVVLHELAHHITGKTAAGRKAHHNRRFWDLAVELYERYAVDLEYARKRESNYKDGAAKAFARRFDQQSTTNNYLQTTDKEV